ncbi:alpha/beta hydrolase family protein [Tateyamaria omphalii]|uniref:Serine aminopeptidase S33 domain-containing protein n=1 Tax=Tateyamaria omphalii TaxID=299262 RepID=A0A1P8MQR9_9RHOB|nr:alpha/beta hydrolase [Tateyamaria omphalii]APX10395.1 hypothetical protein BWR18_00785 [Tateyamaria omphalii]
MRIANQILLVALLLIANISEALAGADDGHQCKVGVFSGSESGFVAVTRSDTGFKYTFDTGLTGDVGGPDAPVRCLENAIDIVDVGVWPHIAHTVTYTSFKSRDVDLAGQLIEPPDRAPESPLVIFAHGSEDSGWLERARDPYQMVGRGISVFVYDKRGTGQSGGAYTQNFGLLADDLVAASREAKRLARGRFGRFGLIGLSQGGWVAPLAAPRANADFIAVGYGLVMDIREEDAAQVALELRAAGFGDNVQAKARQITDATAQLARHPSAASIAAFDEVRNRFADALWLPHVRGDYTGILLDASVEEIETVILPLFESYDIDWSIDPVDAVRAVRVPQLWVFAGNDRAAPPGISIGRLRALEDNGQDITIRVFPRTDHGMWDYVQNDNGTRSHTRITAGYYDLMADWASGALAGRQGAAQAR